MFVHEFGHYWVARRCGVRVESFSIGFGKEIFGWKDRHGTRWKVSWLPLGGYVKMFGDADPSSARPGAKIRKMTAAEKRVAFYYQNVWKRMAIVVAGPAANYLFAIILLSVLFTWNGQPYASPLANDVAEKSAAAKAGLMKGDLILQIDDTPITTFEDIKRVIMLNAGTPVRITIRRDADHMMLTATPEVVRKKDIFGGEHSIGQLGITSTEIVNRELSPLAAVGESFLEAWHITAGTLRAVGQMIIGVRETSELGWPLRIAEMSGKVAKEGPLAIVSFLVSFSIGLGLINLFPIPLLDGGHLAFYIAEVLRGRPLSEKAQEFGARLGLTFVLALMLFATWNDLVHLRVISYITNVFS